ncbi:hypothetical protein A7X67_05470 [Clostridium sp. W14A]|nr:hypothetical protein A7X67_05470 [Clostridium sp. W14A]
MTPLLKVIESDTASKKRTRLPAKRLSGKRIRSFEYGNTCSPENEVLNFRAASGCRSPICWFKYSTIKNIFNRF